MISLKLVELNKWKKGTVQNKFLVVFTTIIVVY